MAIVTTVVMGGPKYLRNPTFLFMRRCLEPKARSTIKIFLRVFGCYYAMLFKGIFYGVFSSKRELYLPHKYSPIYSTILVSVNRVFGVRILFFSGSRFSIEIIYTHSLI